jgi:hypothetical protein
MDKDLVQFNDFKEGAVDESKIENNIAKCCLCKKNAQVWMHWNAQLNRYFYTFCHDHKHTLWEALNGLQRETVSVLPIPESIRGEEENG